MINAANGGLAGTRKPFSNSGQQETAKRLSSSQAFDMTGVRAMSTRILRMPL